MPDYCTRLLLAGVAVAVVFSCHSGCRSSSGSVVVAELSWSTAVLLTLLVQVLLPLLLLLPPLPRLDDDQPLLLPLTVTTTTTTAAVAPRESHL